MFGGIVEPPIKNMSNSIADITNYHSTTNTAYFASETPTQVLSWIQDYQANSTDISFEDYVNSLTDSDTISEMDIDHLKSKDVHFEFSDKGNVKMTIY